MRRRFVANGEVDVVGSVKNLCQSCAHTEMASTEASREVGRHVGKKIMLFSLYASPHSAVSYSKKLCKACYRFQAKGCHLVQTLACCTKPLCAQVHEASMPTRPVRFPVHAAGRASRDKLHVARMTITRQVPTPACTATTTLSSTTMTMTPTTLTPASVLAG